jgi:nucleoside-diphosphate-sugar epimerase
VSGGTGFLGKQVVPLLKEHGEVVCISRSSPDTIRADLTKWDGDIKPEELKGRFDCFVHMAGLYNLRINEFEGYRQNVMGTHSALTISQKAQIPFFVNTSTIAVTMGHKNRVQQANEVDLTVNFPDYYSRSKAIAENMIRFWPGSPNSRLNLRLGVLVGKQGDGKIQRIDGPYHAAESIRKISNLIKNWKGPVPLPGNERSYIPLLPVDVCAKALVALTVKGLDESWVGLKSLHLTPKKGLTARNLYESIFKHFGLPSSIKLMPYMPDVVI